jgi:hypothetical protein
MRIELEWMPCLAAAAGRLLWRAHAPPMAAAAGAMWSYVYQGAHGSVVPRGVFDLVLPLSQAGTTVTCCTLYGGMPDSATCKLQQHPLARSGLLRPHWVCSSTGAVAWRLLFVILLCQVTFC